MVAGERALVNLQEIARELVDHFISTGCDVNVEIDNDVGKAFVNPVGFKRTLSNLIENACKYGKNCTVIMKKTQADKDKTYIRLEVADSGPGIAEDKQDDVFKPFYRLEESRSRETGGTGLGLSVVRNFADSHGGRVELHNLTDDKGHVTGLQVNLTIPLSESVA